MANSLFILLLVFFNECVVLRSLEFGGHDDPEIDAA